MLRLENRDTEMCLVFVMLGTISVDLYPASNSV